MEMDEISRGWSVFSEDGKRVGDVVEVHPHYLLVSRGLFVVRDLYVPRYAVAAAEDRKVRLAITEERLRHMGWTSPPPPPPDVDTSSPHLVPTYEADEEYGPPPLENLAATPAEAPAYDGGEELDLSYLTDSYAETYEETEDYGTDVLDDYGDMGITFGPTIEVDDAYLAYRRAGDGPAVVCVHGWGLDQRIWDYLTLDLAADHTVVTYDGRGYGGSSAPASGYDLGQASRDLRVLLRTLELEDATIVAVDSGAAAALHYVLSGGQRAGRLVLVAPVVAGQEGAPVEGLPQPLQDWRDQLRRDRPLLASRLAEHWAPQASPETRAWLRDALLAAAPYALLNGLSTLAGADVEGDLAAVTVPVLVLQGEADPLGALANGPQIAETIPAARFVALDPPGHLPMLADPERVAAEIRGFVAETSAPASDGVEDTLEPGEDGNEGENQGGDAVPGEPAGSSDDVPEPPEVQGSGQG